MSARTVVRPALSVQGKMRVFLFPSVRKMWFYWWKQSRIPLCSHIQDQLFGTVQSTFCLWMCTPHSTYWLCTECSGSLVCAQRGQKFTTYDLSRQTLQREGTSQVLVQVTGVHIFTVNLLKAQVVLSLNSWNLDLHSGKLENTVYLTYPANFQRVYNPAVPDRCSGRFLDFFLMLLHI